MTRVCETRVIMLPLMNISDELCVNQILKFLLTYTGFSVLEAGKCTRAKHQYQLRQGCLIYEKIESC